MKLTWGVGPILFAMGAYAVGCGSSTSNGGDTTGGSSSASSSSSSNSSSNSSSSGSSSSSGQGGQGGGINPTGSGGAGGEGTGGSAGGGNNYASCADCTSPKGAQANECQAEYMACMEWKTCVSIYNCTTNGVPGGPGPCSHDSVKGACCSLQCEGQLPDQEGIMRYRALDSCIHCKTCAGLCNTEATYCAVFAPGGDTLCNP